MKYWVDTPKDENFKEKCADVVSKKIFENSEHFQYIHSYDSYTILYSSFQKMLEDFSKINPSHYLVTIT